jgi:hypothetical protein
MWRIFPKRPGAGVPLSGFSRVLPHTSTCIVEIAKIKRGVTVALFRSAELPPKCRLGIGSYAIPSAQGHSDRELGIDNSLSCGLQF